MDQLASVVEANTAAVNWFALGDAKRLASEMKSAVRAYRKTPEDAAAQQRLRKAAEDAANFLNNRGTDEARQAQNELSRALGRK